VKKKCGSEMSGLCCKIIMEVFSLEVSYVDPKCMHLSRGYLCLLVGGKNA
jgi:hypothetical protein